MKLRLYSDLHREFDGWDVPKLKDRKKEKNYVAVLAGDIGVARRNGTWSPFIFEMAERHKAVIYVPGNHEYYGDTFDRAWEKITGEIGDWDNPDNLYFMNGDNAVTIDGVRFIGATLWTDFELYGNADLSMYTAATYMNDYRVIGRVAETDDDEYVWRGKLRPADTRAMHYVHKEFIDNELYQAKRDGLKTMVITHHGPTRQSIAEHFAGSDLNPAYASDLSALIRERAPDVWVHGHTHHSAKYWEGKTLVMTNPKGYPERGWGRDTDPKYENPDFREDGLMPEIDEVLND